MGENNIRFRKRKVSFTQVSNNLLEDKNLSWKAKGIYSLIQRYITIEDWNISIRHLISMSKDGRDSFETGWKELKKAGYLKQYRIPSKEKRGQFDYEYELLDIADTSTPSIINCDINGNYKLDSNNKEEDKLDDKDDNKNENLDENDHIPEKGGYGQKKDDHIPEKPPYGKTTTCLNHQVVNGGDNNNIDLSNTEYNNINTSSSIKNDVKTYCSLEDPNEVERKIDELMEFTLCSFKKLDYRKFLNASRGDMDIIKYVYENTLTLYSDANREPIKNMVMYIIKGIEKELKNF